jgi:hypothetical protein
VTPEDQAALWLAGSTAHRLWSSQRAVYELIKRRWRDSPSSVLCHRDFGKSRVEFTIADRILRTEQADCAIVFKTKDHAREAAKQVLDGFLEGCPPELRPRETKSEYVWSYPLGGGLFFFGADHDHVETARGRAFRFVGLDEAGRYAHGKLTEILYSIMLPAVGKHEKATGKRGHVALFTTSPMDDTHDFWPMHDDAMADGRGVEVALDANPDFSAELKAQRAHEYRGRETEAYQREYGCARIRSGSELVLPGVTPARIAGTDGRPALVQRVAIPGAYREWYAGMDIGGRDLTAVLWGYYEPSIDTVVIAREAVVRNASTPEIARAVREAEAALWPREPRGLERWSDHNPILLRDLDSEHGLRFAPTRKDEKLAQLGELRDDITTGHLVIDVGCPVLLQTLRVARWNTIGKGWQHEEETGHADLLDALLYLRRNVTRRPLPQGEHTLATEAWQMPPERPLEGLDGFRAMLEDSEG